MVRITMRFMVSTEKFVRARFSAEAWTQVRAALKPETSAIYDRSLSVKDTVEFTHVADMLATVDRVLGPRQKDVLFELGLFNSEEDLSATQRLIMKIISVEWVLKAAALLWGQRVKNGGRIEIKREAKGHVAAIVSEFPEPTREWWTYLAGWFTCAIRMSGGQDVAVEGKGGGASPADPAIYDARWG